MIKQVEDARFPHWCKIYRVTEVDQFAEEDDEDSIEVIYEGKCRKYSAKTMRTYQTNGVFKEDYAVSIPEFITGANGGCHIDVEDETGKLVKIPITNIQPVRVGYDTRQGRYREGTSVFFNNPFN